MFQEKHSCIQTCMVQKCSVHFLLQSLLGENNKLPGFFFGWSKPSDRKHSIHCLWRYVAMISQAITKELGHCICIEAIWVKKQQIRYTPLLAYMNAEAIWEHMHPWKQMLVSLPGRRARSSTGDAPHMDLHHRNGRRGGFYDSKLRPRRELSRQSTWIEKSLRRTSPWHGRRHGTKS